MSLLDPRNFGVCFSGDIPDSTESRENNTMINGDYMNMAMSARSFDKSKMPWSFTPGSCRPRDSKRCKNMARKRG